MRIKMLRTLAKPKDAPPDYEERREGQEYDVTKEEAEKLITVDLVAEPADKAAAKASEKALTAEPAAEEKDDHRKAKR